MRRKAAGFNLIEVLFTLAIMAILFGLGFSSFRIWLANSKVRAAADSVQNAIQLARNEALQRNTVVRFQIVSGLSATCTLVPQSFDWSSGPAWLQGTAWQQNVNYSWVVSVGDATAAPGGCPMTSVNPNTGGVQSQYQLLYAGSIDPSVAIDASYPVICFNGLGQMVGPINATAANCAPTTSTTSSVPPPIFPVKIVFGSGSAGSTCVISGGGGNIRCLQVCASSGAIRMCDRGVSFNTANTNVPNPLACYPDLPNAVTYNPGEC